MKLTQTMLLAGACVCACAAWAKTPLYTEYIAPISHAGISDAVYTGSVRSLTPGLSYSLNTNTVSPGSKAQPLFNYCLPTNKTGLSTALFALGKSLRFWSNSGSPVSTYTRSATNGVRYVYCNPMSSGADADKYVSVSGLASGFDTVAKIANLVNQYALDTTQIANKTLYCQDVLVEYRFALSFDKNGATGGTMASTTFDVSTTVPSCAFTRTGHSFTGWRDTANGNKAYAVGDALAPGTSGNDPVLQAQWQANSYTVTFDPAGGTYSGATSQEIAYGAKYGALTAASWTDGEKTFLGWYLGSSNITASTVMTTASNHTLVAYWKSNVYTVTFDPNAADATCETEKKTVTYRHTYGSLPDKTNTMRPGYDFVGWYTASTAGSAVSETTEVAIEKDHTLYAHWTGTQYAIALVVSAGVTNQITHTTGTATSLPDETKMVRRGYVFGGWYEREDLAGNPVTQIAAAEYGERIFHAKWTPIAYTVVFAPGADDTAGTNDALSATYDQPFTLPACGFTRELYAFSGWRDATGGVWAAEAQVSNLTDVADACVTLTATWRRKIYRVTFDPDAASGGFTKERGTASWTEDRSAGDPFGTLPVPDNTNQTTEVLGNDILTNHYVFAGWWTAAGRQVASNEAVLADETLCARWKGVTSKTGPFPLTFDAGKGRFAGGTSSRNITYERFRTLGTLPDAPVATTPDYVFAGWCTTTDPADEKAAWVMEDTYLDLSFEMLGGALYAQYTYKPYNDLFDTDELLFATNGGPAWVEETEEAFRVGSGRTIRSGAIPYEDLGGGDVQMLMGYESEVAFVPMSAGTLAYAWRVTSSDTKKCTFEYLKDGDSHASHAKGKAGTSNGSDDATYARAETSSLSFTKALVMGAVPRAVLASNRVDIGNFLWTPADGIRTWVATNAATGASLAAKTEAGATGWKTAGTDETELASGTVSDRQTSWVRVTVTGKGVLTFDWQVSCEPGYVDTNGVYQCCDRLELWDGTNRVAFIDGTNAAAFASFSYAVTERGTHALYWRYVKDDSGALGEDAGRVRAVVWTPDPVAPEVAGVVITSFDPAGALTGAFVVDDPAAGVTLPVRWELLSCTNAAEGAWIARASDTCALALTGDRTNAAPADVCRAWGAAVTNGPAARARFFKLTATGAE